MKPINLTALQFAQRGVAAVEFALIAVILFTLLFGIMEFGRVLFMMNTATEATRLGARLAVVCDKDDTIIKTRMVNLAGFLNTSNISVAYSPNGCDASTCHYVTVSVTGLTIQSLVPLVPFNFDMHGFSTTLPRESMSSLNNPICT